MSATGAHLLVFLVVACAWSAQAYKRPDVVELLPSVEFRDLLITTPVGVTRHYRLAGLAPRTRYEVRVSVPGHTPARLRLAWRLPDGSARRRLLDVDKLVFDTDDQGRRRIADGADVGDERMLVDVTLLDLDVSRADGGGGPQVLYHYVIVVDRVVAGIVPEPAVGVVAFLGLGLAVSACLVHSGIVDRLDKTASAARDASAQIQGAKRQH